MDEGNEHHYPPNYPEVNPQYLEYIQDQLQGMFQQQLRSMEQAAQEKLANAEAGWMKRLEENKNREAVLEDQLNEMRKQLDIANASRPMPKTPESSTAHLPIQLFPPRPPPSTPLRIEGRSSSQPLSAPHTPGRIEGRSSSQPLSVPRTPGIGAARNKSPAYEPEAVRKLAEHQLSSKEIPEGATWLKEMLELHIRMLWGHLSTTSRPPEVDEVQLAQFNKRFSEHLSEADLANICKESQPLISPNLVQIQASIPLTPGTAQSCILSGARRLEEFVLEYIQAVISKFGLLRWCPDLTQSAGSVYNSACRIIALDTFRQVVAGGQYRLGTAEKFLKNMPLLIAIYNSFVHYRMHKTFEWETLHPGKTKELAANNPAYQNRYRLCQSRREFLKANGYKRYLKYIDPKSTSDDEVDPDGMRVKGRPVHFIKIRRERSERMNTFIRILDRERELAAKLEGKMHRQERIRIMPDDPEETAFPLLPFTMPIDYYDPAFFNSLQPGIRKRIAGDYLSPRVGLLPNILHSFGHGPDGLPLDDEGLGERAFNKKFGPDILAQYQLSDLAHVIAATSDDESEDDDDLEEDIIGNSEAMEEDTE